MKDNVWKYLLTFLTLAVCADMMKRCPVTPDYFKNHIQSTEALVGDDTLLQCHTKTEFNVQNDILEWSKEGEQKDMYSIRNGKHTVYKMKLRKIPTEELKKGNVSLTFLNVTVSDSGQYCCCIIPNQGHVNCINLTLKVKEPPPKVKDPHQSGSDVTSPTEIPKNNSTENRNLGSGHIAGIVIACVVVGGVLVWICWCIQKQGPNRGPDQPDPEDPPQNDPAREPLNQPEGPPQGQNENGNRLAPVHGPNPQNPIDNMEMENLAQQPRQHTSPKGGTSLRQRKQPSKKQSPRPQDDSPLDDGGPKPSGPKVPEQQESQFTPPKEGTKCSRHKKHRPRLDSEGQSNANAKPTTPSSQPNPQLSYCSGLSEGQKNAEQQRSQLTSPKEGARRRRRNHGGHKSPTQRWTLGGAAPAVC